ncbi:MAG: cation diffusion facilitator family transporter [Spirochaetaceae bacterium]|nr:cation diffusion facilitator family transporter [Spirochaetaceae bacterium]
MKETASRALLIQQASIIALTGNLVLAASKITIGILAGSLAVVGDGIDTSVDVLISMMTLFVSRIIARPADEEHPWGHGRAETVATAGLSFILFFAGIQLVISAAQSLFTETARSAPEPAALVVTTVSIIGKLLLALNQYRMGARAQSAMLKANAQNMAADVVISVGVLVGLGFSIYFDIGMIDLIAALLVGLWVIKAAVGIFLEVNSELMDGGSCREQYKAVFEAVHSVEGARNPHRTRIRSIAGFLDIDIDIEVDRNLTVHEAHKIATKVEEAIQARVENIFDVMIHIEPHGEENDAAKEAYGLNEGMLS